MIHLPPHAIWMIYAGLWIGFAASWILASRWSAPTARGARFGEVWPYRSIQFLGFAVFAASQTLSFRFGLPRWRVDDAVLWSAIGAMILGFAFCWWARLHLGRLWSANVERKGDHRVVQTGPYALVRHPIYTGILMAVAASAIAMGNALAFAGLLLVFTGFWMKARLEERFLCAELGADAYDSYARTTPMLLPLLKF